MDIIGRLRAGEIIELTRTNGPVVAHTEMWAAFVRTRRGTRWHYFATSSVGGHDEEITEAEATRRAKS